MKKYLYFVLACLFTGTTNAQSDTSHYFRSFDNVKIYYEDTGTGYPVILVHGFLNTSQNWKRTQVYESLKNAGYRVIILDLRGNGKSDKPQIVEAYSDDAEAKDIITLANRLQLKSYNVIGYSRGSIIDARLLVLDNRINKAVLGGMGTDFTNPEWPRRKMFYHVLNGDTTVAELQPLIMRLQKDSTLNRVALTLQQKEQPSTPVSLLQSVSKPVLVVCGKQDSDNGNAKALAGVFRKGVFAEVPGDHGYALTTKEFAEETVHFFAK